MVPETDVSDYIILGILSQKRAKNGKTVLYPRAFMSEKMSPAEYNYSISNK